MRSAIVFMWLASIGTAAASLAGEPLHQRIDAIIAAAHDGPTAARSSDTEFLRRVWLDLAGTIPAPADARAFLTDTAAEKRAKLVDRLLNGPDYPRRMQQMFTALLLERRTGTTVADEDWDAYLRDSFAENKPLDQLVREILAADGVDPETKPAMKFFLARSATDHTLLARDVSRLLLGRNLGCAQCHDHLFIDDYKQSELFGLVAYLDRSYLYKDKKTGQAFFAEKGTGDKVEFKSVFADKTNETGPRLFGRAELAVPVYEPGEELVAQTHEGQPPQPKFPLRPRLAEELTHPDNTAFAANVANRLWAMLLGRGLVEPLDMLHAENPPSHPALLEELADHLVANRFDVRNLLRQIALSETYQRSSQLSEGLGDVAPDSFAVFNMKSLSAEQLAFSVMQATGSLPAVLAVPADRAATAQYRPDKGRDMPAVNIENVLKLFQSVYAAQPGQPEEGFNPSLAAALFLANEKLILSWLVPHNGNLLERLMQVNDADATAEELYLTILTRLPTDEERASVANFLETNADGREAALREMAWALLASAEFRLNH